MVEEKSEEKDFCSPAHEEPESSKPATPTKDLHTDEDGISVSSSHASVLPPGSGGPKEFEPTVKVASQSSRPTPAIIVPRAKRRGLLAFLTIISEVTVASDMNRRTKWILTALVAVAGAAAPTGSTILLPALSDVQTTFDSSPTITNLSVALYMLSMSIFPLWWSSFSETLGRRTIYIASFIVFTVFALLSALSTNIGMFIAMRMLSGGGSASVQAVGAGTIADLWEVKERGRAMSLFYLGPLCGPLFGPIIGGAMAEALGWRSTQWFLVVYGGITLLGIIFLLPETLPTRKPIAEAPPDTQEGDETSTNRPAMLRRVSTRKSVQEKTKRWLRIFRRWFVDPLSIILYLRFPAVLVSVYYASIAFGSLYVLSISIQRTFKEEPYGFSTLIIGLLFVPNGLGYMLTSLFGGKWIDSIMHREARKAGRFDENGKLIFRPEDRMRENAWLGAIMFPSALLWYGWAAEKGTYWLVPMVANFFFGVGSMLIFALVTTMLTEFLPRKASAGIAVNNFVRNIASCVGGIVADPIIAAIGNGWLFTILTLVCIITGPMCIIGMKRYGERWGKAMDKALEAAHT